MKRKSAVIGFSYLFGLICASFLERPVSIAFAALLSAFFVGSLILKKHAASTALFTVIAAIGVYTIYSALIIEPVKAYSGRTVEITGAVAEKGEPNNDNSPYLINAEIDGRRTLLSLYAADINAEYGDTVRFTASLSDFVDNTNFAESSYYFSKNVFLKATVKSPIEIIKTGGGGIVGMIFDYSDYIKGVTRLYLSGDEGDIITAFFFGDKSGLDERLNADIKYSGVSHFASVSGMHLTLILGTMLTVIGLTPLKSLHKTKFLLTLVVILGFMIFFKFSVSVIRSGIMLIIFYAGEPLHRKADTLNSVGLALLLILIISPTACRDTGLLLSVAGTVGIGCAAPAVCRHFSVRSKYLTAFIGTMAATMFTIPLSALFFGGFSVSAVLTNLLITPFFTVVLICMLTLTVTGAVFCQPLLLAAGLCTKPIIMFITVLGGFKYSYLPFKTDFAAVFIILCVVFVTAVALIFGKTAYTLRAVGVSICAFCLFYTLTTYLDAEKIKIRIYSDGSDSCIMIDDGGSLSVIATNDSEKILRAANAFMRDCFADGISLLYFCRRGDNNLRGFEALPIDTIAETTDADTRYSVGNIRLDAYEDFAVLRVNGFTMTVSKAGTENIPQSNAAVLYGYRKQPPEKTADYVICSDRKMNIDDYINAYRTQTEIILYNNRFAIINGGNGI